MKRSCNGCMALQESFRSKYYYCSLGYDTKEEHREAIFNEKRAGSVVISIPLMDCPKPRTYKKLVSLMHLITADKFLQLP